MNPGPLDLETDGACPTCQGGLGRESAGYRCRACRTCWPIVDGVPRFVDSEHYAGSFGYQWLRFRRTQLDDERSRESEETFAAKTGLTPAEVRGKRVLDVGVGAGRFSDVVAHWGGFPVGVDLSRAVLSAHANLARHAGAQVLQADLFRLPFRPESFDIVFSIGVLHHTPSTAAALNAIARFLKPGGVLAAAVYVSGDGSKFTDRYRRYTVHMSRPVLLALSQVSGPNYYLQRGLEAAFGEEYAQWLKAAIRTSEHPRWEWRVLDTFDWYAPKFQWKHSEPEVLGWFEALGLEEVRRLPEPTMVSVRGRRRTDRPLGSVSVPPQSTEAPPLVTRLPPPFRDMALVGGVAAEVARAIPSVAAFVAREDLKRRVTRSVIGVKRALGVLDRID